MNVANIFERLNIAVHSFTVHTYRELEEPPSVVSSNDLKEFREIPGYSPPISSTWLQSEWLIPRHYAIFNPKTIASPIPIGYLFAVAVYTVVYMMQST